MAGIGVIFNPFSKKYKKNPHKLDQMAFIIGDKASYKPTEDLDDLHRVAEEFKSRDIEVLAISGGDGTIHCTLTAFVHVYGEKPLPKITFLRGGTLDTIPASLGIFGNTESLLSKFLIRYHENDVFVERKLRLMRINNDYGCIFGLGVVYNFMEDYYRHAELNALVAAKTLVESIGSALVNGRRVRRLMQRFDAEVTVDGERWPFSNYCALLTGSVRQLGLDFDVFNSMLHQSERFHAMGMSLMPHEVVTQIKRMHDGKPAVHPGILEKAAQTMEIHLEKPLAYTIDGDMLPPQQHIVVSAGPELTVLV